MEPKKSEVQLKIEAKYKQENDKIEEWNRKWFSILERGTTTREELQELGFHETVINAYLKNGLPTIEECEAQTKQDYGY